MKILKETKKTNKIREIYRILTFRFLLHEALHGNLVNKAVEALVNQLPVATPTPTPNDNTLKNPRSGLVNSGSGGTPSESQEREPGKRVWHVLEEDNITFNDADADGVLTPHNDVLVISLIVHDTNVKRVLIDPEIPPEVMTHKLNEDPSYPHVKQKKRKQRTFKNQVIQEEVQKLLKIGSIRELNPEKCVFGAASGKFFGFLVSNHGIEVNPAQIKAIEEIPDILSNKKEVQRLTGRIAALRRFISKSSEKCFKFFSALKKHDHFEWNKECQQALKNLKTYLSNPHLLAKPKAGEKLLIYLAVSEVVGMQLEAEKELQVFNGANPETWTLFTDGSSNVKGAGLGIVLIPPTGKTIRQAIKCHSITNKKREYEAVIAGLELKVTQIPRDENVKADALANLASAADVASDANASVIHLFHSVLDPDKNEGMDIVGPLPQAKGQVREKEVKDFIWRNIICRFGVPKEIVCDNRPQFIGAQITEFLQSWQIKRITSTPYHPVGNGQAESTNKVIINNLKKRLEESKVEIGEPSTRFIKTTQESNDEEMRVNLDLLKGRREVALIRMAAQKQVIERYYNRKARLRFFKVGDFMLKKVFQSTKAANTGKLSPTWEGPNRVRDIAGKGAYELETMDDKILPSHWNGVHLKRYYF
ncbi:uncharacterized protein [Nicotiana sylvestris]|uniref:uncharacterized protein n=1 Tax=Nicotiana sylvestris TaxID=4096 RepID=UPI00388C4836